MPRTVLFHELKPALAYKWNFSSQGAIKHLIKSCAAWQHATAEPAAPHSKQMDHAAPYSSSKKGAAAYGKESAVRGAQSAFRRTGSQACCNEPRMITPTRLAAETSIKRPAERQDVAAHNVEWQAKIGVCRQQFRPAQTENAEG